MILKHLALALWNTLHGRWCFDYTTGEYVSLFGKRRPLTVREERAIVKRLREDHSSHE